LQATRAALTMATQANTREGCFMVWLRTKVRIRRLD
jgi:hypothetical protein